jgi:hypothetical protein
MRLAVTRGDGEQMKIVVAEHGDHRRAKGFHRAQHAERIGAAIDQVSDQPQAIVSWRETDQIEELLPARLPVTFLGPRDRRDRWSRRWHVYDALLPSR